MRIFSLYEPIREKNNKIKSVYGGSPNLLFRLMEFFEEAVEIKLSFFLYNNPFMHKKFEDLAAKGCKIIIYTTPLNSYDQRKVKIQTSRGALVTSKYAYAKKIFDRVTTKHSNIELRYIPHTNLWSAQKTSRGNFSYALHNKSLLIKYPGGKYKCFSTSSNFALGDPLHSENLFISERDSELMMFLKYFELLHQHSLSLNDYRKFSIYSEDFEYITLPSNLEDKYNFCYFSAPFIKYNGIGSNHYIQQKIIDFIKSAKREIIICTQHFSDVNSFDIKAKSLVIAIKEVAEQQKDVRIKILKQTQSKQQRQGKRTKLSEEVLRPYKNISQKVLFPLIHDKFIIVDDHLMVTTANFTCTQFAWSENHLMSYIHEGKQHIIRNTFSDINSFHFVYSSPLANRYRIYFHRLWELAKTI